jgi:hypothetical protein
MPPGPEQLIAPRREFFFQSLDDVAALLVAPRDEAEDGRTWNIGGPVCSI